MPPQNDGLDVRFGKRRDPPGFGRSHRAITSDQDDPSANSPCTRTTLRAFVGPAFEAMPRLETSEAAAPATKVAEKLRRFIIMICLPYGTVQTFGDHAAWAQAESALVIQ
jgi:hypothetical protein